MSEISSQGLNIGDYVRESIDDTISLIEHIKGDQMRTIRLDDAIRAILEPNDKSIDDTKTDLMIIEFESMLDERYPNEK